LRNDPLLAVLVEKGAPGNQALAGKSTLNRLELTKETVSGKERYKKIALDHGAVDRLLVEVFLEAYPEAPKEIILDLDATTIRCTGTRKGASSMATMETTATYRCTSSAESSVVCAVAIIEHRCRGGKRGRVTAHRGTDSFRVAPGAHDGARGLRILPRGADGLV